MESIFDQLPKRIDNRFFYAGVTAWNKWVIGYRFGPDDEKMFCFVVEPECKNCVHDWHKTDIFEIIDAPTMEDALLMMIERVKVALAEFDYFEEYRKNNEEVEF